jgi:gliding motility-associated protein GldM
MPLLQRTVVMPALLAGLIFIAVFFSACSDRVKTDIIVYKALDESLVNSNAIIERQSRTVYTSLEEKLMDAATSEKAKLWYPKAKLIQKLSTDIYIYMEDLKTDLKKEAGLKPDKSTESFREADKNAVIRLFDKNGKGKELYEKLQKYKTDMLEIDSQMNNEFENTTLLTTREFELSTSKQEDFTKTFFDDIPTIAALAMLSKFANNVRIVENKMISFCNNKTVSYNDVDDSYSTIITQSSSYVRAGEEIEITAGIGAFSKAGLPKITIDGKDIPPGYSGAAIYKVKASVKAGKHIVPVEISYIDQDGKKQTIEKQVEYTVVKEAEINN